MAGPCVIVRAAGARPPWELALGNAHVTLTPAELRDAQATLAGADCVLLDASLPDVLGDGRRISELEPLLQVLIVASAEARPHLEHAMLFVPGLGEVWVVDPAQVRPELLDRARAITAQRRAYRGTRVRLQHDLATLDRRTTGRAHISDAYLAALLSVLPDPIISIDPEDRILSWNTAAERTFGVTGARVAGTALRDVLRVTQPSRLSHLLAAAATDKPARTELEYAVAGRTCIARITVIPVESAGYRVRAVVINEVTEERRAQAEAERARAEADAASRAKSEFLATMSHEIRTPINAIIGYTELLEIGVAGPLQEQQRAFLERVHVSGRHLLTLIEDILDLTRIEAGKTELTTSRVRVSAPIAAAIALVEPQAQARQIDIVKPAGPDRQPTFEGDEDRVRQILVNLLSNAIKFTEPGGRVKVTCGVSDIVLLPALSGIHGPWTYIRVADTGCGIAPADLERVFQPFEQAEQGYTRRKGGTGLGLAISRELARLMGGDLTAESSLGVGSTFTLWLPQSAPGAAADTSASASAD